MAVGSEPSIATDLTIDKSDRSDPVYPSTKLIHTLQKINNVPLNSTRTVIHDALPSGISFFSATDGGTYDSSSHIICWAIGSLIGMPLQPVILSVSQSN